MKFKQKLLSIVLMVTFLFGVCSNVFAKEAKVKSISNEELESTIEGIIHWAKKGENKLLNPKFLTMVGTTPGDWFPIGMGRYGYKDDYGAYLSAIEKDITKKYKTKWKLHRVKTTEWHRISLAVLAMGGDPTKIGVDSKGNPINLIADGSYNCVPRRGVDGQGINGSIWSLISMDSGRYEIPKGARYSREDIIKLILKEQLSDGGFSLGGNTADPDITAMTMQALAPYYNSDKVYEYESRKIKDGQNNSIQCRKTVKEVIDACINLMGKMQNSDGDYFSWGTQNVESTVQVLTALCSLGIDCEKDSRFIKNGKTLIDGIMKYRNPRDGGFLHSYTYDPDNPSSKPDASNNMASEQTLYGLVSYWRLRHNMRNLYDFRPETNQKEFIIKGNDVNYNIAFDKNKKEYNLQLDPIVKEISFINIPIGPYDTSNIKLNSNIKIKDGDKIEFQINNRQNKTEKFVINIVITDKAKINNVINNIKNLPEKITLKDENKILKIEKALKALNNNEKKQVNNIEKFNSAKEQLKNIKNKLEKDEVSKRKEIISKINTLPQIITLEDKNNVINISNALNNLDDFPGKKELNNKVKEKLNRLEELENSVKEFDKKIFRQIHPMNITVKDKENVVKLMSEYEKFNKKDRKFIENYDDVLLAKKVISNLEERKLLSNIFENIVGSDVIYSYNGKTSDNKNYTISFNGTDIENTTIDVDGRLEFTSKNDKKIRKIAKNVIILSFAHEGKLPGKAKISIDLDLKDGEYYLYYFDEKLNKVNLISSIYVRNGKTSFEIKHCSDYFISSNPNIRIKNTETKNNNSKSQEVKSLGNKNTKNAASNKNKANLNLDEPKTGDNRNILLFVVLSVLSGGAVIAFKKKKVCKR